MSGEKKITDKDLAKISGGGVTDEMLPNRDGLQGTTEPRPAGPGGTGGGDGTEDQPTGPPR